MSPTRPRASGARVPVWVTAALALVPLLWALGCGGEAPAPTGPADGEPAAREPAVPPAETGPDAGARAPVRGLWVLCEGSRRVLDEPERVEALMADAAALGATDLFVQVYRGGRAWFDSSWADAGPYREIRERTGVDTLALLLERAEAEGLRVHAWVNALSLSRNGDAPILRELGRGIVLVDQHGRSLLDYPGNEVPEPDRRWYRMGTRGVYLDPAAPGVSERLATTFAELVERYPGLAGVHLDYIRYPDVLPFIPGSRFGVGLDFGYGEPAAARFRRETGLEPPGPGGAPNANRWDAWRRERVTEVVSAIRTATRAANPDVQLSAAVASHVDRAYLSLYQDWKRWLEEGLLDFAVAMIYTLDDRMFRYQVASFASGPDAERIWAGVGVWLFARRPERALRQLEIARDAGAVAEVLFSYDAIHDAPALLDALRAGPPAPAPVSSGAGHGPS
ncbi:MAG: glycoside hydrolase family 10 protein [Myxococcota bacterium]